MAGLPRLLVIMGSGETSPTMSKVHREVFARFEPSPVPAAMLDTPFGFQENADDIVAKAVAYFRESVGRPVALASYRSSAEVGSVDHETALARLREARWVFSGPGSPSHALRMWRESKVPGLLAEKLRPDGPGGCVTFASAAAVTLGRFALPVYEIYKVGEAPFWLEGLDLMGEIGLQAVVIPHFNNAEGGNHDTRYCYMGERRLRMLEGDLPEGTFVLGVDEHTACVLDLDTGRATVAGLGGVTVRVGGHVVRRVEAGESVGIRCLAELGGQAVVPDQFVEVAAADAKGPLGVARSPLLDDVARLEREFDVAVGERDAKTATGCVLELDDLLHDWSRDTLQSDELDRGRAALRSMIVRLGEAANEGLRDPREALEPLVAAMLEARREARAGRRWSDADAIRDRLLGAGIEVRDTPAGTDWQLS